MEDPNKVYEIIKDVGIVTNFVIFVIYFLSAYWNIRSSFLLKPKPEWKFLLFMSISALVISTLYGYLAIHALNGDFTDVTKFGTIFIRPAILLMGGAITSVSRIRYLSLKHERGGEKWSSLI